MIIDQVTAIYTKHEPITIGDLSSQIHFLFGGQDWFRSRTRTAATSSGSTRRQQTAADSVRHGKEQLFIRENVCASNRALTRSGHCGSTFPLKGSDLPLSQR
jgi:hypothetical protein